MPVESIKRRGHARAPTARAVLLLDDDAEVRRALARAIGTASPVVACATVGEALEVLDARAALAGAILDVGLPDGSGLDVLRRLREDAARDSAGRAIPALILSGADSRDAVRTSHLLDAPFLPKPLSPANLAHFLQAIEQPPAPSDSLMRALRRYAMDLGLRPSEVRILSAALGGTPRADLAAALDLSENTIKTQIRLMLARTDEPTLEAVLQRVLAQAAALRR